MDTNIPENVPVENFKKTSGSRQNLDALKNEVYIRKYDYIYVYAYIYVYEYLCVLYFMCIYIEG
jgi:hypothetical protein